MAKAAAPVVVKLSAVQLEALLAELREKLPPATCQLLENLLRTLQWVLQTLEEKTTSIGRLKRWLFGAKSEKTAAVLAQAGVSSPLSSDCLTAPLNSKHRGHGRQAADSYTGAQRIRVAHPRLAAGGPCPDCAGKLRARQLPSRVVHITAQPLFAATLFEAEVLRCNACGKVFTAPLPTEAGVNKYDANVGPMLALWRFGAGVPMYRTAKLQKDLGVPLPASTQWELMEESARQYEVVFDALVEVAATAERLYSDDTTMRVQSLRQPTAPSDGSAPRTGVFTTGIIAEVGAHKAALFFTGRNHAGENLDRLLQQRASGLALPIHMCDALSRNISKQFETILCHCLAHGRRNFVEVVDHFPQECRHVLESLSAVYGYDEQSREEQLSPVRRLAFHQEKSGPLMQELQQWMRQQLDDKKTEPNSGLGQAIRYMLGHWEPLTRFLSVPGAPLDNNVCERGLKMAILHRKNSLSFKTLRGAQVGDLFMSLIHTCRLNAINPFAYFTALQQHAEVLAKNPRQWLPWNFAQTLRATDTG
jgi:transposase